MIKIPFIEGWLQEPTREWGEAHGAEFVKLGLEDDAYFEAFGQWWLDPRDDDLIIVEHDIVPPSDWPPATCEFDWCSCWYWISIVTGPGRRAPTTDENRVPFGYGLGCARFSAALRLANPDVAVLAGEPIVFGTEPDEEPPKHWTVMDSRISFPLMRRGYLAHDHGEARHLR